MRLTDGLGCCLSVLSPLLRARSADQFQSRLASKEERIHLLEGEVRALRASHILAVPFESQLAAAAVPPTPNPAPDAKSNWNST